MSKPDAFLPADYTIPVQSNYMKLQEGVNRFRILASPILGMEYWKTLADGKRTPIRKRMGEKINVAELEINPQSGKLETPQHFWAMPVYNYQDRKVQILEVKQTTILKALKSYIDNPKWGSPLAYDIVVSKEGQGLKTEYTVDHDPKEDVDKAIMDEFMGLNINLEALFDGQDPFASPDEQLAQDAAKALGVN